MFFSADRHEAFLVACEEGHTEIVEMLLSDNRVNPLDEGGEGT
jgi:hypothetical protein